MSLFIPLPQNGLEAQLTYIATKLDLQIEPIHKRYARNENIIAYYDADEQLLKIETILPDTTLGQIEQLLNLGIQKK